MSEKVLIFDTTLRDGEQSPGCSMNLQEKLKMAHQLERLNVDVIEAGFPIASDGDCEAVQAIAAEIRQPIITALARTNRQDIERAWEAIKGAAHPRIHTFIATSDIHLEFKLRKSRSEVLEQAIEAVKIARDLCSDVEFSAEDATRSDIDYLAEVFEAAIENGATTINIPDTVGYAIPQEYGPFVKELIAKISNRDKARFSCHCHDDLGLAVANSLAGVENGCRQVECTINGIGERAGNASLEEIVMALRTRKDLLPYHTDIVTEEIYRSSRLVSNLTGAFVQANKAVVGKNAFAHEAGIHQDGMLKHARTYEIMTPQSVGIISSTLVMGKHSGRHALSKKYEELGYQLNKEELERAYFFFTKLADQKKEIYDEDLITIVQDGIKTIPDTYKISHVHAAGGNQGLSSAVVRLTKNDETYVASAHGDGPVDALYKAVDQITGLRGRLLDYSVNSVSRGKDALGEVFVHVSFNDRNYTAKAASVDIIDASARAYVNAVNKALYEKKQEATGQQPESVSTEPQKIPHKATGS
ncbi:MAG: 2-isopropylmalate synthase [Acidobacteria bacterium]|nr:MAG: 2-isopropylmalate synthase [Acidobacteriota bacterium]